MSIKTNFFIQKFSSNIYLSIVFTIAIFINANAMAMRTPAVHVSQDGSLITYVVSNDNKNTSDLFISYDEGKSFSSTKHLTDVALYTISNLSNNFKILYAGGFENSVQIDFSNSSQTTVDYLSDKYENFSYADLHTSYNLDDNTILLGGHDSDNNNSWLFVGNKDKNSHNNELIWHDYALDKCSQDGAGTYNINSIAGNANNIFIASENFDENSKGLCTSKDLGKSWNMVDNFPDPHASAVFAIKNSGIIYGAGFSKDEHDNPVSELYISNDNGLTWNQSSFSNFSEQSYINEIIGNENGSNIYIATDSNGLWHTQNNGKTWEKIYFSDHKNYSIKHISSSKDAKIIVVSGYVYDKNQLNNKNTTNSANNNILWISNDFGKNWHMQTI